MRFGQRLSASRAFGVLLGTMLVLLASCMADGAPPNGDALAAPYDDEATAAVLALGARGPAVSEVQAYLQSFGYFPDSALAAQYPNWRSVTTGTPEPGVYDEATAAAVRALQARNGLQATGAVDPETRELLAGTRCGNPDSLEIDPDSKFAIKVQKWPASKRSFTWKAVDPSNCVQWRQSTKSWVPCDFGGRGAPATREGLRQLAIQSFNMWAFETDISFTERASGTTDITFQFAEISQRTACNKCASTDTVCKANCGVWNTRAVVGGANTLAATVNVFRTSNNQVVSSSVNFNEEQTLSFTTPTPGDRHDMWAVALHEVGHVLSLDHSSSPGATPVMKPTIGSGPNELRLLAPDDRAAISTQFDLWNTRPGLANDLAVGGDGSLWHIGTAPVGDGFRIYRWNTFTRDWDEASGGGGAWRIAVTANGTPWVLTTTGAVFWHSANVFEGGWSLLPGMCAKDIGIGANNSVWFVTCTPENEGSARGGFKVGALQTDGFGFFIREVSGAINAKRIGVAPNGIPWVVDTSGNVLSRLSADLNFSGWQPRPGVFASDITVSPESYPYVTGAGSNAGKVYIHNYQPLLSHIENGTEVIDVERRDKWIELARLPTGSAMSIAAASRTTWVTNTNLAIFEQTAKSLF